MVGIGGSWESVVVDEGGKIEVSKRDGNDFLMPVSEAEEMAKTLPDEDLRKPMLQKALNSLKPQF